MSYTVPHLRYGAGLVVIKATAGRPRAPGPERNAESWTSPRTLRGGVLVNLRTSRACSQSATDSVAFAGATDALAPGNAPL